VALQLQFWLFTRRFTCVERSNTGLLGIESPPAASAKSTRSHPMTLRQDTSRTAACQLLSRVRTNEVHSINTITGGNKPWRIKIALIRAALARFKKTERFREVRRCTAVIIAPMPMPRAGPETAVAATRTAGEIARLFAIVKLAQRC
jgi:hypothetical protein